MVVSFHFSQQSRGSELFKATLLDGNLAGERTIAKLKTLYYRLAWPYIGWGAATISRNEGHFVFGIDSNIDVSFRYFSYSWP
jgi:hypothetical protein